MEKIHLQEYKILKLKNVLSSKVNVDAEDVSIDVILEQMQSYIKGKRGNPDWSFDSIYRTKSE